MRRPGKVGGGIAVGVRGRYILLETKGGGTGWELWEGRSGRG